MAKRSISDPLHPRQPESSNSRQRSSPESELRPAKKPRRASKPKVKSGCFTCKARRVKCDETKPQCIRCLKFGRTCDGYPPDALSRASSMMPIQPRIPAASVTLYSPSVSHHSTEEEALYFRVFSEHSAFELSGFFDTDFWTRVVLQESHQNVPIRHAIIALGALHKSLEAAPGPHLKVNVFQTLDKRHYESAVLNHVKSIQALNQYISSSDSPQLRVALISCLLFVCFETFVGSFASSVQQTYGGLKILKNYYVGKPGSRPWIPSKSLTKTIRNKRTEISKALQIRPGCDSVSKDVTMTKHLEEYLDTEIYTEDRGDTKLPDFYGNEFRTEKAGIPATQMTGTTFAMGQQQTMTSIASAQRSTFLPESRQRSQEMKSPDTGQMATNVDVHDHVGLQSKNLSTVNASHSMASTVSTPATYTTPSSSGTTSPGYVAIQRSESSHAVRPSLSTSRGGTPSSPPILHNDNPIEDSLIQTFVRLDGHGMFFGMVPGIPPLIWDIHEKYHLPIPPVFTDFSTAHRCWDFLMDRCLQFYRRTLFNRAYAPHNKAPDSEIRRQYASYKRQLSSFASAYKPLLDSAISPAGEILHPAALIWSIYHKATIITLAVVISDSEMVYDAFLPDFRYITHTCALIIASQSVTGPRNLRFSFDVGIVPPLHITATKCRDPFVRREAVELLFASPRQEGMWDGVLTARIGKWIISCEEDGLSPPLSESSISQDQTPEELGAYESYPSPASVSHEGGWEKGERIVTGVPGAFGEYASVRDGAGLEDGVGLRFPDGMVAANQKAKTKNKKARGSATRHWMVPEENRIQLTVVDFHIPDRYIKVKCQKALVGEDGMREQRETVIAW